MFFYILLLFTVIPVAELFLLVQVGEILGFWYTFSLVLLTGLCGAIAVKSQSREVLNNLNVRLQKGEFPSEVIVSGFFIFVGGIFLVTPGFLTDGLGFLFLFPVTRKLFAFAVKKWGARLVGFGNVEVYTYSSDSGREVNPDYSEQKPQKPADVIEMSSFRKETTQEFTDNP